MKNEIFYLIKSFRKEDFFQHSVFRRNSQLKKKKFSELLIHIENLKFSIKITFTHFTGSFQYPSRLFRMDKAYYQLEKHTGRHYDTLPTFLNIKFLMYISLNA